MEKEVPGRSAEGRFVPGKIGCFLLGCPERAQVQSGVAAIGGRGLLYAPVVPAGIEALTKSTAED